MVDNGRRAAEMTVSMLFWRASRPKTKDKVEVELQAQKPRFEFAPVISLGRS